QRRSLRTVSNGHTTEYPEWLTCFRPVIPILSDRQATRRRPPNEPAKNRQMKLTVTHIFYVMQIGSALTNVTDALLDCRFCNRLLKNERSDAHCRNFRNAEASLPTTSEND